MVLQLTIAGIVVVILAAIIYALNNEEKVVEKAQNSKSMFNFYHVLALMTSSKYKGYISTTEERKAMNDYLNGKSVYDTHPIGGYLQLRKENKEICRGAGSLTGNPVAVDGGGALIGFVVLLAAAVLIGLGIAYGSPAC